MLAGERVDMVEAELDRLRRHRPFEERDRPIQSAGITVSVREVALRDQSPDMVLPRLTA